MSPMPPSELGAFAMIRTAWTRLPNSSMTAVSSLWIAPEWPSPSNATICADSAMPSSASFARSTASTGASFSRVSGSLRPDPADLGEDDRRVVGHREAGLLGDPHR